MTDKLKAAQAEQEPVAWLVTYGGLSHVEYTQPTQVVDTNYQPLYAAPPRREWVGLTDDEIEHLRNDQPWWMVRDIEAKLREKNT